MTDLLTRARKQVAENNISPGATTYTAQDIIDACEQTIDASARAATEALEYYGGMFPEPDARGEPARKGIKALFWLRP